MDFEVLNINEFVTSLGLDDLMKGIPHIIYNNEDKIEELINKRVLKYNPILKENNQI